MRKLKTKVKKLIPEGVFKALEPEYHRVKGVAANLRYGFPARSMRIIGVTGTNGKTSTCHMIHRMLTDAGLKTALMTTVSYGVGDDIKAQHVHMTTADAGLLQRRIAQFKKQNVEWLVLETTSHALAQYRTWGVSFEIAVLTNVTHEHLDYHGTFEKYLAAKRRMFEIVARHKSGFAIINADDENAGRFEAVSKKFVTYGVKNGQHRAKNVDLRPDGSSYKVTIGDMTYDIVCKIPGEFNVYNSLAAVEVGHHLGLTKSQIEQGIAALEHVEGRMNKIDQGQSYTALIDFAHTPDSFERLLSDLRRSTKGKLVAVFGSAGRRDESKRAIQGEIAGKYCDALVLTEEDDRDVDGKTILEQIAAGAARSGKTEGQDMFLVLDRPTAIRFAVTRVSQKDDTVVFLGKGHEKTIERADGEYNWSESEEVRQAIKQAAK